MGIRRLRIHDIYKPKYFRSQIVRPVAILLGNDSSFSGVHCWMFSLTQFRQTWTHGRNNLIKLLILDVFVFSWVVIDPCLFQQKMLCSVKETSTLPETSIAPEIRPSQKETIVFQPSIFRGYVSFREGIYLLNGMILQVWVRVGIIIVVRSSRRLYLVRNGGQKLTFFDFFGS